jgi:hypothetical protein
MDLAGPLRKGLQKEKYFLVAAYTLPEGEAVGQTHEEDQEEEHLEGAPDPSDPFDELPASDEEAVDASYLLEDQPKELEPLEGEALWEESPPLRRESSRRKGRGLSLPRLLIRSRSSTWPWCCSQSRDLKSL